MKGLFPISIAIVILSMISTGIFWHAKNKEEKIWSENWYWILMIIFALTILPVNVYLFRGKMAVDDIVFGFMIVVCMLFIWYTRKTGSIMFMRIITIGGGVSVGFFVGMGIMFYLEKQGIFDFHVITPPILRMVLIFIFMILFGIIADYLGKRRGYLPFM